MYATPATAGLQRAAPAGANDPPRAGLRFERDWPYTSSSHTVVEAITLAFTSRGHLVVPVPGDGVVRVFSTDGDLVTEVRGLTVPAGAAVDGAGNLYVSESRAGRVSRYTPAGIGFELDQRIGAGVLEYPTGVAISEDGTLYVGDKARRQIVRFDHAGEYTGILATTDGAPAVLTWHRDAGLAAWVGGRILRFDASRGVTEIHSTAGTPSGIAYDPSGSLLFTTFEGRVLEASPASALPRELHTTAGLGMPLAIAAGADGAILILDATRSRVLRFSGER